MKKRKESLIGYASKNWRLRWSSANLLEIDEIECPGIVKNNLWPKNSVKVKITIE